jgi:FKBP-type peptidyl-prolyl cis-trans isomerase FklB
MNKLKIAVLGLTLASASVWAADSADKEGASKLKETKDKVGYSIGVNIGGGMKKQGLDTNTISVEALAQGMKDALTGAKQLLTENEIQEVMMAFQKDMMSKMQAKQSALGESNKKEGAAFLEANKKKEGVKTTASGLQYIVEKEGTGKTPTKDDTVVAHYRGTLTDGTEFDSSYKRNEPLTIPVTGVIKGWTEALQLMKEGAKWKLFIPSELGYGEKGAGQDIPPNAVLIFDIELLSISADKDADKK